MATSNITAQYTTHTVMKTLIKQMTSSAYLVVDDGVMDERVPTKELPSPLVQPGDIDPALHERFQIGSDLGIGLRTLEVLEPFLGRPQWTGTVLVEYVSDGVRGFSDVPPVVGNAYGEGFVIAIDPVLIEQEPPSKVEAFRSHSDSLGRWIFDGYEERIL